jgi:hypothetical protein
MNDFLNYKVPPGIAKIGAISLAVAVAMAGGNANASSHREGPYVAMQPAVDGTDFYMFRSYEEGRQNYVTFLANYIPSRILKVVQTSISLIQMRCMKCTSTTTETRRKISPFIPVRQHL